jgi:alkylated DNA repair dioxygenase AlkB
MVKGEKWAEHEDLHDSLRTTLTPKLLPGNLLERLQAWALEIVPKFGADVLARTKKPLDEKCKMTLAKPHPEHQGLAVYAWGQAREEYGLVEACPQELDELFAFLCQEHGEEFNHMTLTMQRDGKAGMSKRSDRSCSALNQGKNEASTSIAHLSLGATRKFQFVGPKDGGVVASLMLTHGSHIAFKGDLNTTLMHEVPRQPEVEGARISMVFRKVDRKFVNLTDAKYREADSTQWWVLKKNLGVVVQFFRQHVLSERPVEEVAPEVVQG